MREEKKKILIISDYGRQVGLGHISRAKVLMNYLDNYSNKFSYIKYLFKDNIYIGKNLNLSKKQILTKLKKLIYKFNIDIVILNTSKIFEKKFAKDLFYLFKKINIKKIFAIDGYIRFKNKINKILIPNIFLDEKLKKDKKIIYGWDKTLIDKPQKKQKKIIKKKQKTLLVISGGTDRYQLSNKFPYYINRYLIEDLKINWLLGPFAKIDKNLKTIKNLKILKNKKKLSTLISNSDIILVQFGVTFFEVLSFGIPAISFLPKGKENNKIIKNLIKNKCIFSQNYKETILIINKICYNYDFYYRFAKKFEKKFIFKNNSKLIEKFLI